MVKEILKSVIEKKRLEYERKGFAKRDKWMIKKMHLPHLTKDEIAKVVEVWPFVKVVENDLIWLRAYKKEFGFDPYFVTDCQLSHILRVTNPYKQVVSLQNKSMLDVYFPEIPFPCNYLRCINGTLWDGIRPIGRGGYIGGGVLLEKQIEQFVIKPSVDTGCGKGVRLIKIKETKDRRAYLADLLDSYGDNYVIQEVLTQHPVIGALNNSSVNCCRVTTLLIGGQFDYTSIIKFGKKNSTIDNWNSGYIAGLSKEGKMNKYAYDFSLNKTMVSDSGITFGGLQIPSFNTMIENLKKWHMNYFPQVGIIGWDVLIDIDEKVKVIEINLDSPGVVGEQFCSGVFFKNVHNELLNLMM